MTYKGILLFGAPGSGKGTVGKALADKIGGVHVSSGDVFRGLDPNSPAGKAFHSYASKGNLVPDEVTMDVWHSFVKGLIAKGSYHPDKQRLIMDGLPRTVTQANMIQQLVDIEKVIVLDAELSVFIERLKSRALIENRADDADETVLQKRMDVYTKETLAVLACFPVEKVTKINANQSREAVLSDVLHCINP